jgi:hypothetical protein
VLTLIILTRLEALRLVRQVPDGIQPLPAIARYALASLPDDPAAQQPALF